MLPISSKKSLVLLHGWGVNSQIWLPLFARLKTVFDITVLDLPGYGNDSSYAGDYRMTTVIERVMQAAPSRAVWVAWSLGATIAMEAARRFPDRFEKLQLISPTPRFMSGIDWDCGIEQQPLQELENLFLNDYEMGLKIFLMLQTSDRTIIREQHATLLQVNRPAPENLQNSLRLLTETDSRGMFSFPNIKTQILVGEADRVVSPVASQWIASAIRSAEVNSYGTKFGHLCFLENQKKFITDLVAFAESVTE